MIILYVWILLHHHTAYQWLTLGKFATTQECQAFGARLVGHPWSCSAPDAPPTQPPANP